MQNWQAKVYEELKLIPKILWGFFLENLKIFKIGIS